MKQLIGFILLGLFTCASALAESFQVTLLQAAPGNMPELITQVKQQRAAANGDLLIMRHSQGDHWDLMLMQPATLSTAQSHDYSRLVHFQHDFLATSSVSWKEVQAIASESGLFHIEMFHAAAGKKEQLVKQRQMENAYYHATQRRGNDIFITAFGSDVDSFTIGYYRDLAHFASDPDLPAEQFEKAATDAGFTSRGDIGFYLRQLIISHHDTLATRVD